MIHYHIRWANSKLDWEAFQTEEQARASAEELKRPGENYGIEKRDGDCQHCNQMESGDLHLRVKEREKLG